MFALVLLDVVLVALFEIFGQHDVSVFAYGVHSRFLAYGVDIGPGNLVWSRNVVFEVNLGEIRTDLVTKMFFFFKYGVPHRNCSCQTNVLFQ